MITPRPEIAAMDAFPLADLSLGAGLSPVMLAQNESAFAPSPAALAAARAALDGIRLYPDTDWRELRAAIAEVHGLDAQRILCGSGSMELIAALIRAYAGRGDEVLSTQHGYALFRTAAQSVGADYVAAPETERTVSVDALLAAAGPRTRIVCVANPGNPTGTHIPRAEIVRLRAGLPADVVLLVDEAYAEFADPQEPVFDLVERGDTVVTRTFSKAYGLAGMRAGWAAAPPAIGAEVRKLLNPGNISAVTQAAATAAMRDQDQMREVVRRTAALRAGFAERIAAIGIDCAESHTNFVLLRFSGVDRARSAERALRGAGILVRGMASYGLAHCLRVTVGQEEDMERTAGVLARWKEGESP